MWLARDEPPPSEAAFVVYRYHPDRPTPARGPFPRAAARVPSSPAELLRALRALGVADGRLAEGLLDLASRLAVNGIRDLILPTAALTALDLELYSRAPARSSVSNPASMFRTVPGAWLTPEPDTPWSPAVVAADGARGFLRYARLGDDAAAWRRDARVRIEVPPGTAARAPSLEDIIDATPARFVPHIRLEELQHTGDGGLDARRRDAARFVAVCCARGGAPLIVEAPSAAAAARAASGIPAPQYWWLPPEGSETRRLQLLEVQAA